MITELRNLDNVDCVRGDDSIEVNFRIPESYPYFEGHFPDNPIVPGVVQVGWSLAAVRDLAEAENVAITRYRFLEPILPGQSVSLKIEAKGDRFACQTRVDGILVSKGTIRILEEPTVA